MIECLKIISWNVAHRLEPWRVLVDCGVDAALLQEAQCPPPDVQALVEIDAAEWRTMGAATERPWRTAVVRLSDRVRLGHWSLAPLTSASKHEVAVSVPGTLAVADVEIVETQELITLASLAGPVLAAIPLPDARVLAAIGGIAPQLTLGKDLRALL